MIRAYKKEDLKPLLELFDSNTPGYFHENERGDYEEYLQHEVEDYFVIEIEHKVVGAGGINYFHELGKARISWDLVHKDMHGHGLGSQLLKHRLNLLKKDSAVEFIEVRTTQKVFEFYQKNDFRVMEIHRDFWADGFDMYLMFMPNEKEAGTRKLKH